MKYCKSIRGKQAVFLAVAGSLTLAGTSRAQEALRTSLAGNMAAAAQQQSIGYYNILLGTSSWRFDSAMELEYTDNARLQSSAGGAGGDLIIRPAIDAQMHWPLTLRNSLDLTVGGGYSEYLENNDLSQFFITPGSGISFNVYVGNFKFNLHDRATISEYAYQNTAANGVNQNYNSLQNTAGISCLWDSDKIVVNAGYDHNNYVSLSSQQQGQPDSATENVFADAGLRLRPEMTAGVEGGGSLITYDQSGVANTAVPDATQWSAGVFLNTQISDYIDTRLDGGYTVYTPDNSGSVVTANASGFYFSMSLSHRVNRFVSYTLMAGRSTDLSAFGQAQTYYFVRFEPGWKFFLKYDLSTPVWWQRGTRVYNMAGSGTGDYEQIGAGLTISRNFGPKLAASLSYRFVQETSNQADLNYAQNIVDLNLTYHF